jgi:tetratricopeptide (TPR) repeat protein/predicted phosphodiesterase
MAGLTWLHLSDWHQKGKDFDRRVIRDALINDIEGRTKISPELAKIDFIIFSGDVAYSGRPEEYQAAKIELFDRLLNATGLKSDRLFIVPGNHDLDRKMFEDNILLSGLLDLLNDYDRVKTLLDSEKQRANILEPFQAFTDFVAGYTHQEKPSYANIREWNISGKKIALLGLNSSWACGRKYNDKGFVFAGEPQIFDSLERISKAEIKIAVLHHPFDWLNDNDRDLVETHLMQHCDFILQGHQHKPNVTIINGTSGHCTVIPAGACYDRCDPRTTNAYNFIHLNFDLGKGIAFLRRWSEARRVWIEDIDSHPQGRFEFYLTKSIPDTDFEHYRQIITYSLPVPNQIPPPPRDFKGRMEDLKEILSYLDKGDTIIGIRGMAGIGKTTLAFVVAEKLKNRFSDGQIFVDLHGTSKTPLSTYAAMAMIVRSYRHMDCLPENQDELRGLYLSVLSNKKILLLLDDAANKEQVDQLLPPSGCVVLITSRIGFTLPGLKRKDLSVLLPEEACDLLHEIQPTIGKEADSLAKNCGYLPLALRNAASALSERRGLSVAKYEEYLNSNKNRLKLVDASFCLSYDLLPIETQKQWRNLSVFPSTFDLDSASAILEIAPNQTQEALDDLIKWGLLSLTESSTSERVRYSMHSLARIFADSRLNEDERGDAEQRYFKYYLKAAFQLEPESIDKEPIIKMDIPPDKPEIGINGWDDFKKEDFFSVLQMVNTYADKGAYLMDLRLHPEDRIYWIKIAIKASRLMKDLNSEGIHTCNLGNAYLNLGEVHKAIKCYEKALAISREIGNRQIESADLGNLGNAYLNLGEVHKAIECYEEAIIIVQKIKDRWSEGVNLGNLGNAYLNSGEVHRAIECYDQALAISYKMENLWNQGKNLCNLGKSYFNLGDFQKANDYYKKSLSIFRDIKYLKGEGEALFNMGLALHKLGQRQDAIEHAKEAFIIFDKIEKPNAQKVQEKLEEWIK